MRKCFNCCTEIGKMLFVWSDLHCTETQVSLKHTTRIRPHFRQVKAKQFLICCVFPKPNKNSSNSDTLSLYKEKAFTFMTEPQKTSNGIGSKTTKRLSVNNIKNINKAKKKGIIQIGHSKCMYTYTLRKELSVGLGEWGGRGRRIWAIR